MALFKKFISAVKKLFRGKSSSHRKKQTSSHSSGKRKKIIHFRKRKISAKKKIRKIKVKASKRLKASKKIKKVPPRVVLRTKHLKLVKSAKPLTKPQPSAGVLTGEITHYFSKISVVVVKMTHGTLSVGNRIHIQGKGADFTQKVDSLQIESRDVKIAPKGQLVGLKVIKPAKPGDKVFKLVS